MAVGRRHVAVGRRHVAVGGVALAALPLAFSLSSSSSHSLLPPLILFLVRDLFLVNRFVCVRICAPRVCVLFGFVCLGFVCLGFVRA